MDTSPSLNAGTQAEVGPWPAVMAGLLAAESAEASVVDATEEPVAEELVPQAAAEEPAAQEAADVSAEEPAQEPVAEEAAAVVFDAECDSGH